MGSRRSGRIAAVRDSPVVNVAPTDPAALEAFGRLYRRFVDPGDLVFDVGASIGENVELFAGLGARVVALEPLTECAALIDRPEGVEVLECAVGARPGTLQLLVCERALDTSSASPEWVEAVRDARLARGPWAGRREVPMRTLDDLIADHGRPRFVKIDVEGYELEVLEGLSEPVGGVSLEVHACIHEKSLRCLQRLSSLGFDRFALSEGHSAVLSSWLDAAAAAKRLRELAWGDLYALSQSA
jgi:FkbM family methyltransferase